MCGRSTYKLTWEEIVQLYRLTLDQPAQNTRARYNVCPTTQIDTVVSEDGKCQSALDRDPRSASKRDPLVLRFERLAFAPSELAGVAETGRARVDV